MADKWNEQLRRKMADYQSTPPDGLWEAVESGLARRQAATFHWNWALFGGGFAAAVTAVAALLLLVWHPGGKTGADLVAVAPDTEVVVEQAEVDGEAAAPEAEPVTDASEELPVSGVETTVPAKSRSGRAPAAQTPKTLLAEAESAAEVAQPAIEETPSIPEEAPVPPVADVTPEEPVVQPAVDAAQTESDKDTATEETPAGVSSFPGPSTRPGSAGSRPESPGHRKRTRVHQGMRVSGTLMAASVAGPTVNNSFTEIGMPAMFDISTKAGFKMPDVATLTRNRETMNEVSHSVSGTLGFMLNFPITEQWSLEGGIQRTVLYSSGTSRTEATSSRMTRTTAYTGYPIMAMFTPWRGRHLSAYVSAGPMLEHATRSRWTSEASYGTYSLDERSGVDRIDEWVASVGLAAGAQWEIDGWGALFLQPGFRWRFPGADAIDSYYKERPRTFNLSGGFRFSF